MEALVRKIEELREMLNEETADGELNKDWVLALSQELDEMIVQYYRTQINSRDSAS